ncbi:MAG: helix-turn-helix transcriptional regulator [Spirochaetales bacterium]|nr:helix-turn-helix transcriptional regulator [Spirochaetales bacterium]
MMEMTYRPTDRPSSRLPFGIRSTGHYRVRKYWNQQFRPRHFAEVWYTCEGEGQFSLSGKQIPAKRGSLVILPVGLEHDLTALSDIWDFYWFTLDGPEGNDPLNWFGLSAGCYAAGELPPERFRQLRVLVGEGTFASQKRAIALVMGLLAEVDIPADEREGDFRVAQVRRLIRDNYSDPAFDINALAEKAGMHRSVLSRLFVRETGKSPSDYLRDLRLKTGLSLLQDSFLRVSEIAWRCGFRDPAYFSRLVQSRTGKPPRGHRGKGPSVS